MLVQFENRKNFAAPRKPTDSRLQVGKVCLERSDVGDDVLDFSWLENFFERRHQRIPVFNPGFQIVVSDFIPVHRKGATLGDALQSRTDLLLIAFRKMAQGTFLAENLFSLNSGTFGGSVAAATVGLGRFRARVFGLFLRQQGYSQRENCRYENKMIAFHNAPRPLAD
jgi:hypothetical protein